MLAENSISFPNIVNVSTGFSQYSYDLQSINECLGLLFTTSRGELLGDPLFGTNLLKLIHEPNDYVLQDSVQDEILKAVKYYENRVTMNESSITMINEDNKLTINLNYYVKKSGEIGEFELVMMKGDLNV